MRKLLSAAITAAVVVGGLAASGGSASAAPAGRAAASPGPGGLVPVTPTRLADAVAGAHGRVTVRVAGRGGVPTTGVAAVLLNLTARATAPGSLVAHPHGSAVPGLAHVSFAAGASVSSLVAVPLGSGAADVENRSAGSAQVTADVVGYYRSGGTSTGGAFSPVTPARVGPSSIAGNAPTTIRVAGVAGVPQHGAAAVLLNLTGHGPAADIIAYPHGPVQPDEGARTIEVSATPASTQVIVQVGEDGSIDLLHRAAGTNAITVHVVGYFRSGAAVAPGTFVNRYPVPVLTPGFIDHEPVQPGGTQGTTSTQEWTMPAGSTAVYSVTVRDPDSSGTLTLFPQDGATPALPTVTFTAGHSASSLVVVPAGSDFNNVVDVRNDSTSAVDVTVTEVGFYADGRVGAISGTVTDSTGHPLEGVGVGVFSTVAPFPVTTGPDGTYVLSGLNPALDGYRVCFYPAISRGSQSATGDIQGCFGGPDGSDPTLVPVAAGRVTADTDQQLGLGGEVTGRVTDSTGHPLGNVSVLVQIADGRSVRTAADGTYRILGLVPGHQTICFQVDGPITGGTSATGYLKDCDVPIEVRAGQATALDGHLALAAAISGRVTDSAGNPLAGVAVLITQQDSDDIPVTNSVATGADGTYRIAGLPPGRYQVCFSPGNATGVVSPTGYVPECFRDAVSAQADPVPVGNGEDHTGVDASLLTGGAISGRMVGPDGEPSFDVAVVSRIGGSADGFTFQSDVNGAYRLDGLLPGPHEVCFFTDDAGVIGPESCVDVTVVAGQVVEHVDGRAP